MSPENFTPPSEMTGRSCLAATASTQVAAFTRVGLGTFQQATSRVCASHLCAAASWTRAICGMGPGGVAGGSSSTFVRSRSLGMARITSWPRNPWRSSTSTIRVVSSTSRGTVLSARGMEAAASTRHLRDEPPSCTALMNRPLASIPIGVRLDVPGHPTFILRVQAT